MERVTAGWGSSGRPWRDLFALLFILFAAFFGGAALLFTCGVVGRETEVSELLTWTFPYTLLLCFLGSTRKGRRAIAMCTRQRLPSERAAYLAARAALAVFLVVTGIEGLRVALGRVLFIDSGTGVRRTESVSLLGAGVSILSVFLLLVVLPVLEEFVFRGVVLRRLKESGGFWWGVLISSGLFALVHQGTVVYAFFFGVVAAVLAEGAGTVWASVVMHSLGNSLALLFHSLQEMWPLGNAALPLLVLVCLVCVSAGGVEAGSVLKRLLSDN